MTTDLLEVICTTCGQSPMPGAPRRPGKWNDAGHTDSAHYPHWSEEFDNRQDPDDYDYLPDNECPGECPECGVDLASDGYPVRHRTDEGNPCPFRWQ